MRWKDFTPTLDGRSYGAIELPVAPGEQVFEQILDEAYSDTLASLDRHYVGAVKCYQLDQLLKAWTETAALGADLSDVCKMSILLDHFHARLPLIRSIRKSSQSAKWQDYLKDRMNVSGRAYAAAHLRTTAIFGLMPESWIGEDRLKEAIFGEIHSAGAVAKPTVTFDLKIPKSGAAWMTDTVLSAMEQLRSHLDHHRPQIITYIVEKKNYRYLTRTAIAYGYQVLKRSKIQIDTYHPAGERIIKIGVDLARCRYYADNERVSGFYLENYRSQAVPVGSWVRILKALFLIQASWYLRRLFRHCFGWCRSQ